MLKKKILMLGEIAILLDLHYHIEQLQNSKDVRSIQSFWQKLSNKIHVIIDEYLDRMPPQNQSSSQSRRTPTPTKQVSLRSVSRREEDSQGYEETIDMEELRQSLSRENSRWICIYGLIIVCISVQKEQANCQNYKGNFSSA